jgi:hypothetical protein
VQARSSASGDPRNPSVSGRKGSALTSISVPSSQAACGGSGAVGPHNSHARHRFSGFPARNDALVPRTSPSISQAPLKD